MKKHSLVLTLSLLCAFLLGGCSDEGRDPNLWDCSSGICVYIGDAGSYRQQPPQVAPPEPPPAPNASPDSDASPDPEATPDSPSNEEEDTPDTTPRKDTDSPSSAGENDDTSGTGGAMSGTGGVSGNGSLFGGSGGIVDVIASIGGMFGGIGGVGGSFDWLDAGVSGAGNSGGDFPSFGGQQSGGFGGNAGAGTGQTDSGTGGNADAGGEGYVVVRESEYSSGEVVMDTYPHNLKLPVTFEVPVGWEKWVNSDGVITAYWDQPILSGDIIPGTKLDFSETRQGNEGEAKLLAMSAAFNSSEELRNCEPWPCKVEYDPEVSYTRSEELYTMSVAGITVYVYSVQGIKARPLGYQNNFAFVKDGMLYNGNLYGDHLSNYQSELATIIETLHPVQN